MVKVDSPFGLGRNRVGAFGGIWTRDHYLTKQDLTCIDLLEFEKWVRAKYSKSYRNVVLCYVKKYFHLAQPESNLRELELLSNDVKASVVKALLLYSKFNGNYSQYKMRLSEYGIKLSRPDGLNAFLRILNASNTDTIQYYNEIKPLLSARSKGNDLAQWENRQNGIELSI